jgi:hypothetical protein
MTSSDLQKWWWIIPVWERLWNKVKLPHYRPGQALRWRLRLPAFLDNRHMKLVWGSGLRTGRLYIQEILLVLISVRGWVDSRAIVRPEGLCQWKIQVAPLGIKPVTFRPVAQCLEKLHHTVHVSYHVSQSSPQCASILPCLSVQRTVRKYPTLSASPAQSAQVSYHVSQSSLQCASIISCQPVQHTLRKYPVVCQPVQPTMRKYPIMSPS